MLVKHVNTSQVLSVVRPVSPSGGALLGVQVPVRPSPILAVSWRLAGEIMIKDSDVAGGLGVGPGGLDDDDHRIIVIYCSFSEIKPSYSLIPQDFGVVSIHNS